MDYNYKATMLRAKYDRAVEIGCEGCGETWVATDFGFKEAAKSLDIGRGEECISCNDELADKCINGNEELADRYCS